MQLQRVCAPLLFTVTMQLITYDFDGAVLNSISTEPQQDVYDVKTASRTHLLPFAVQVLLYLIRMADCSGIDLTAAV